jgi:hypothetical protein
MESIVFSINDPTMILETNDGCHISPYKKLYIHKTILIGIYIYAIGNIYLQTQIYHIQLKKSGASQKYQEIPGLTDCGNLEQNHFSPRTRNSIFWRGTSIFVLHLGFLGGLTSEI